MLTSRGWWFLLFVLTLLAMGGVLVLQAGRGSATLLLLALALALWFAWEWGQFTVQARLAVRNLDLGRELRDDRGPVTTLWAGQTFSVRCRLRLGGSLAIAHALVIDRPPAGAGAVEGELRHSGPLVPATDVSWEYRVHCPVPGALRFEGARVQLADVQGFFYFETFLRRLVVLAVLPKLVDAEARQRATKRFNLLPPPGIHRLRRPGSGSELLDLRDYRPGDPPKRIAWKASARRDKLITRELESEVPIRCTLFVDASDAVRLGPPGQNALAGLTTIAATVAQAAAGNRDLVGVAVCDRHAADYVAPARSPSHTVGLLRRLARVANLAPAAEAAEVGPLIDRAYAFATQVYPDLLRPEVNRFPAWLAYLSPQPAWTMRRPPARDAWRRTTRTVAFALMIAGVVLAVSSDETAAAQVAVIAFALGLLVGAMGLIVWLGWGLFAGGRRRYAWRKKLAAILAVRDRLPPGALGLFLEDDAACSGALQRFLAHHQVPYEVPLYDARGRYLFARPAKVEVLAKALLRAVGRGHDNELYVILADLLELDDHLGPLLKAVRVARSRHHTVLLVCPWPAGLPAPEANGSPGLPPADLPAAEVVRRMTHARMARAWRSVRRAFGRMGVPVLNATAGDPARLILHRLEQLRAVQGASRDRAAKQADAGMSPLANAYLLVGLGAVAVLAVVLMQAAGRWALIPTLIGAAGLAFRWRAAPLVLLAAVAFGQLGSSILASPGYRPRSLGFDLALCAATVTYVIAQYRLIGLTTGVLPPQPRKAGPIPPRIGDATELVPALLTVAAATIGAFFAWEVVGEVPSPWLIPPGSWRVGLLAWMLLGGCVIAAAVLGQLGWRRLSRDEAAVFLQDALWHETRREQRRINRWRAWALRRR